MVEDNSAMIYSYLSKQVIFSLNNKPPYICISPSYRLKKYVKHYWLGLNNQATNYTVLPDGSVDIVIQYDGDLTTSMVYGTTTSRMDLDISPNFHYVGIRFKPGMSRHFMNLSAQELTNAAELSLDVLAFSLEEFSEQLPLNNITKRLDTLLERHLKNNQPDEDRLDQVIALIEDSQGLLRIEDAVVYSGKSRRQFERIFKEAVGVSPKFFSLITRFSHATTLITQLSQSTLADIAADAGYSDQSHMNHDFKRMTGVTPKTFLRDYDAFLQYTKKVES